MDHLLVQSFFKHLFKRIHLQRSSVSSLRFLSDETFVATSYYLSDFYTTNRPLGPIEILSPVTMEFLDRKKIHSEKYLFFFPHLIFFSFVSKISDKRKGRQITFATGVCSLVCIYLRKTYPTSKRMQPTFAMVDVPRESCKKKITKWK